MSRVRLDRTTDDEPVSGKADIRDHVLKSPLPLPQIDGVLITYLRTLYKPRLMDTYTMADYAKQLGQQELIEGLERLMVEQQQDQTPPPMCMAKKQPAAQTPAAAAPPPADPPSAPVVDAGAASEKNILAAKRAGRRSLRIDLAKGTPAGGAGLNVPT